MTTSLDSYLHGRYRDDGVFLGRLRDTIEEVLPLFYKQKLDPSKLEGRTTWPYAVSAAKDGKLTAKGENLSASTHCMIVFALDALAPRDQSHYSLLLGRGFRPWNLPGRITDKKKLQQLIVAAKKTLVDLVNGGGENPLVESGTYGQDDPFTLTWLTEIAFRWTPQDGVSADDFEKCKRKILEVVERILKRQGILDKSGDFNEVTTSFLRVRRLHLAKAARRLDEKGSESAVAEWLEKETPDLWRIFDDTIHRQLSYSSMGESKFDPAELALAFEGALLLHPTWVGRYTIDGVFDALKLSRNGHPYWRPITPFLANEKGHVLFMVSIEVANSILRACEILDEEGGSPSRFSQIEPQLRAYAMWLLGEVEELSDQNPNEPNLVGWRTEYEDKRNTIQLWHTSHVLVFLLHYASLLKRKIAADGVSAAGLEVRTPKLIKGYWSGEPLPSLAQAVDSPYSVLRRIKSQYIDPRTGPEISNEGTKSVPLFSMLLYGPPGTGKTTVAEQLAVSLKRPLIIVTVSDFLAAGAAEIENRAKGVFRVLRDQEEVVILFDEIDQFLLDRNSDFYQQQDDVFKFMTPGMLTKLQDLRDEENCVFVVATNYYERIDSAIKRRGRIDEHFLLSIPDNEQRLNILERFSLEVFKKELEDKEKKKQYEEAAKDDESKRFLGAIAGEKFGEGEFKKAVSAAATSDNDILRDTTLFGWGDLKNLVESRTKIEPGMNISSLTRAMQVATGKVDSAVSLSAYRSRFEGRGPFPFEEFFILLYLVALGEKGFSASDEETIHQMLNQIPNFEEESFKYLRQERIVKEQIVCDDVARYLADVIAKWKRETEAKRKCAENERSAR